MPVVDYTVIDGEIVHENRGGVERDYVPDPLGSTVALLDSARTHAITFRTTLPDTSVRRKSRPA
jgi:hypothetical protein